VKRSRFGNITFVLACTTPKPEGCPCCYDSECQYDCSNGQCTCFSGDDNVTLFDGSSRAMRDLQVGDLVWTVSDDMKTLVLSEVFMMPHNVRDKTCEFSYSANIVVRTFCN
jgi:hypothetical protein